jgi:hypothetical protein
MKKRPANEVADLRETIADLRRELAHRTAERDEALAQQTATAESSQRFRRRRRN